MQRLRQEEQGFDVQVHDPVPTAFGKLTELCAPSSACIVDENVDFFLTRRDLFGKRKAAINGRQVTWQANHLTAKFGNGFLNLVHLTRADIHPRCACLQITLDNHLADAARAARDNSNPAIEVE